jgi:hypothetical protein
MCSTRRRDGKEKAKECNLDDCAGQPKSPGSVIPTSHRLPASTLQENLTTVEGPSRTLLPVNVVMFNALFRAPFA